MPLNNPFPTGTVIKNRYRISRLLGKGGFGAVYLAWDSQQDIPCALKENFDTSPKAQRQFEREASILANLEHPNLPCVKDHFSLPGQGQFLVMDFVEGENLQEMLDRTGGPLKETQVLPWILQVLDAITYLNGLQPPVIHRDIKPANIRITPDGQAVLVDFGIAKLYDPLKVTTVGARAVTPGFSPFEQYGHKTTDLRTDIYALGATLYTLLTGAQPSDSIGRVAGAQLVKPRTLNPAITLNTEFTILKAMEIQPARRFQSATEFADALRSGAATIPVHKKNQWFGWKFAAVGAAILFILACTSSFLFLNRVRRILIDPGTPTATEVNPNKLTSTLPANLAPIIGTQMPVVTIQVEDLNPTLTSTAAPPVIGGDEKNGNKHKKDKKH
jgi:serine/threonine protein kinase, bacterial